MPIIKSAQKAARQAVRHTAHNREIKKESKAALKDFKANPSMESFAKAQSEYDKAAKKGLIKKNTAARRKATLAKFAKEAGVKFAEVLNLLPKRLRPKQPPPRRRPLPKRQPQRLLPRKLLQRRLNNRAE